MIITVSLKLCHPSLVAQVVRVTFKTYLCMSDAGHNLWVQLHWSSLSTDTCIEDNKSLHDKISPARQTIMQPTVVWKQWAWNVDKAIISQGICSLVNRICAAKLYILYKEVYSRLNKVRRGIYPNSAILKYIFFPFITVDQVFLHG
jgi:hypothetical protein